MGKQRFTEEFKRDAVDQIMVRGYAIAEVSRRLGVSKHSLYAWIKKHSTRDISSKAIDHEVDNKRLKRELARVTEERDILKRPRCTDR